jgi:hypothetical protein
MMKDEDVRFHTPATPPPDWAETGYFNFYIPEINLIGFIYIVHRAGVGATVADIEIMNKRSLNCLDTLYMNLCNHNALPERAEDFALESGLTFKAPSIRDYEIGYKRDGVELVLRCEGLMEPYDIHDPTMDPLADPDQAAALANSGFGAAYTQHFDMTVRMTGRLSLGGRDYPIDCVSTMDHSWGPRPEHKFHPIVWMNAHLEDGRCFHGIFSHEISGADAGFSFKHGYALVDGAVRGGRAGMLEVRRSNGFIDGFEWSVTDIDGREHRASGKLTTHHPWLPYGNNLSPMGLVRWETPDGGAGIGTFMEGIPLNRLRGDAS